jgi:hypothetical protein
MADEKAFAERTQSGARLHEGKHASCHPGSRDCFSQEWTGRFCFAMLFFVSLLKPFAGAAIGLLAQFAPGC